MKLLLHIRPQWYCREKKTTLEMMNVMFVNPNSPTNLWVEAICLMFLQNWIPHKKSGNKPYELWKRYPPNVKFLKVWSYLAKVMLQDPKKRKTGSKTSDCTLIRYADHIATSKFLMLKSDVLDFKTVAKTKKCRVFKKYFFANCWERFKFSFGKYCFRKWYFWL